MATQDQWRFCDKCHGMFWDGAPNTVCPAGDKHHAQGFMFTLPFNLPETPTAQTNWRFCDKCHGMFFAAAPNSRCPVGGQHNAQGVVFTLPHDQAPSSAAQDQWRFCDKCHGMFWDGAPNTVCPAGDKHHAQGFMFVLPHTGFPDIMHFDADSITSNLALGGSAHLVVRKNGDFTFSSHVHDSGFSNIRYALAAVLVSANGIAFTFGKQGRVEGTEAGLPFGTPNRNDDFTSSGNNPTITTEFDAISAGSAFVAKLSGQDLLVGGINDFIQGTVVDAAKQLGKAAVSAVISLVAG
jgi:hypothetical protein